MPDIAAQRAQFFQKRRDDVGRDANASAQAQGDAINRRMTSIGQANSGAAVAAQMKLNEAAQAQKQSALNDVTGQELQAGEGDLAREQQGGQFGQTLAAQKEMFNTEQGNKLAAIDMAQKQFAMDQDAQAFNMRLAELQSGQKVDLAIDRKWRTGASPAETELEAFKRRMLELEAQIAAREAERTRVDPGVG